MRKWILDEAGSLPEGWTKVTTTGLPPLAVQKQTDRPAGLFFSRTAPVDDTLGARLQFAVERKAAKLAPYHALGKTTLLLLDCEDVALMSWGKVHAALDEAFARALPKDLDLLWFADSSDCSNPQFWQFVPRGGTAGK